MSEQEMIEMFDKIQKDRFLIECLNVIIRDFINEYGVEDLEASKHVKSICDIIDKRQNPSLTGIGEQDVDKILQRSIPNILKKEGVIKS